MRGSRFLMGFRLDRCFCFVGLAAEAAEDSSCNDSCGMAAVEKLELKLNGALFD